MAVVNPYKQYKEQSVETATPGELVIMLFDGAIKNIRQGMNAVTAHHVELAHNSIVKAQSIFEMLRNCLDHNYEISDSLGQLYAYMIERLVYANVHKEIEPLQEVLTFAEELRATWQEAERRSRMEMRRAQ